MLGHMYRGSRVNAAVIARLTHVCWPAHRFHTLVNETHMYSIYVRLLLEKNVWESLIHSAFVDITLSFNLHYYLKDLTNDETSRDNSSSLERCCYP